MTARAAASLLAWLRGRTDEMTALLEELVLAESPSLDPAALERAHTILTRELEALDLDVRRVPGRDSGGHVYARPRERYKRTGHQLLIGHLDTVWPVGTSETMPFRHEEGDVFGPGVFDMKGGLVEIVFALRALAANGLVPAVTPVVFVNADEEIGSLDSRRILVRLARGAVRALVLEGAAGSQGKLKTARKGSGRFTLVVHGRAAHAGTNPEEGVSAIVELAEQVRRVNELNDAERGVTVNVGTVDGGLRPNVVAPVASAEIDVRVPTLDDANRLEQALSDLQATLEGASVKVTGGFRRPPMEPSPQGQALFRRAQELAALLDLELEDAGLVGGGSDANLTSPYAPTLDGLGPVGGGAHAADERIVGSSLAERAALLALLVLEPASGHMRARRRWKAPASPRVLVIGTPANETNRRLVAAWLRLGIDVELVPAAIARGMLCEGDVALTRLDVLPTLDGVEAGLLDVLLLERAGFRVLNGARALLNCHDKWRTACLLDGASLPHPRTARVAAGECCVPFGPPFVVKPRFGSWGKDVEHCLTREELDVCLARAGSKAWFRRHGALVQELVPSTGVDLRVVVAGGVVVGAVQRVASAGEWRTNTALGATRRQVDPPEEACLLALAAATAAGVDLAGVDLLPLVGGGYTVLELNGAVDFTYDYSLGGGDPYEDTAAALGLLTSSTGRAGRRVSRSPASSSTAGRPAVVSTNH